MKDKCFIYYGNPCITPLTDPALQTLEDAEKRGLSPCRYYPDRQECSPPKLSCIQLAGAKMARYVIQFYSEVTDETLAMEKEEFRRRAPLPPKDVEAYLDPEHGYQRITDPDLVVQRVWEYARAVLDLQSGERVFRSSEETWEEPLPMGAVVEVENQKSTEPPIPAARS